MDTNLEHIYNIIIANWKQLIDVIVKQPNYIPENDYIDRLITDTLDFLLDVSINPAIQKFSVKILMKKRLVQIKSSIFFLVNFPQIIFQIVFLSLSVCISAKARKFSR